MFDMFQLLYCVECFPNAFLIECVLDQKQLSANLAKFTYFRRTPLFISAAENGGIRSFGKKYLVILSRAFNDCIILAVRNSHVKNEKLLVLDIKTN